jgi:transglutaminase-like putative cysteine protease
MTATARRGGTDRSPATSGPPGVFAALAVLGLLAWVPALGLGGVLRVAPLALLALLAATWRRRRVGLVVGVAALPWAWLAAGLPVGLAVPARWGELGAVVGAGFWGFADDSGADAIPADARAALTGLFAASWMAAAAARRYEFKGARALGLLGLIAPALIAEATGRAAAGAWLGAAVLAAAFAWYRPSHVGRRVGAAHVTAVAGFAVAVAAVVGPREAWFSPPAFGAAESGLEYFDPSHSYGPLTGERGGATLLRVRARRPAYWRAQVLSRFDGRGWEPAWPPEPRMAEPGARRERIRVEVARLRNAGVFSPGAVVAVQGGGPTRRGPGQSIGFQFPLDRGDSYRVQADVTRPSPDELAAAPKPLNPRLRAYTAVELGPRRVEVPLLGSGAVPHTAAVLARSSYRRPLDLARRLSRGAGGQLDVVRRVERFLERRYRYETDVEDGERPLEDFLFRRRTGYCQHFSGAAALLLRLSGVPARVVTGFAPGVRDSSGAWRVRDLDTHSWVEVYFEGTGWVTVDPTPSTGPAAVPPAAEPLHAAADGRGRVVLAPTAVFMSLLALGAWGACRIRRRRLDLDAEATRLLSALARRASAQPPGTTYGELASLLERAYGPETARLARMLEERRFASGATTPPVRTRAVWRALRRDSGSIAGCYLAGAAIRARGLSVG